MNPTTVQRGPASKKSCIHLSASASLQGSPVHTQTCAHPTHQNTSFCYSCFFLLNASVCTASLTLRGVFVFREDPPIHTTIRRKGGAGETVFLASRTVNLRSYVHTNTQAKVCGKVWCYLLNHEVTFTAADPKATPHVLNVMFHLSSFPPPSGYHASVAAPTP